MLLLARICFAITLLTAVFPAEVRAATLLYELTGPQNVSFTLTDAPAPDVVFADGFAIRDVAILLDGQNLVRDVRFANALNGGGFVIPGSVIDLTGAQLFSGARSSPILLQGQFSLTGVGNQSTYTLNVRQATAPVPEPSTWLLLMVGFGAVGAALRRTRVNPAQLAIRGLPTHQNE